ncbi:hypothetical protein C4553_03560 [Candidatus Parcubacteria bacterium]|nr:MAG: hypothetical protein C4553_03560 [Candidatus Parcubacteria bacterium]
MKYFVLIIIVGFFAPTAMAQVNYYSTDAVLKVEAVPVESETVSYDKISAVVGKAFVLDGTKSVDEGAVRSFQWRQVSGPFKFTTQDGAIVSFTPNIAGTYVFELVVTDNTGLSSIARKTTVVVASPESIFQPNETNMDFLKAPAKLIEGDPDRPIIQGAVPNQTKESGEKGGTEDINIGVGELQEGEDLDLELKNPVSIKAVEVRGWDPQQKQDFLGTVKEFAEVKSEQDLENFAKGALIEDENLDNIAIGEEGVQIAYKMPAKFLGVFNVSIKLDGEVDDEGQVKIKYPWYGFLFRKQVKASDVQAEAEKAVSGIKQTIQTQVKLADSEGDLASLELQAKIQQLAQTFQTLSNIMKTKHDTAMNAIRNIR